MRELRRTKLFQKWLLALRDLQAQQRIDARLQRLAAGNPGHSRSLGGAVSELKIDYGPGYRVYFTERGEQVIVLLCGGDKSSQTADIRKAKELAASVTEVDDGA